MMVVGEDGDDDSDGKGDMVRMMLIVMVMLDCWWCYSWWWWWWWCWSRAVMVVWVVVVDLICSSCNVSQTWIFGRDMQYQRQPVTLQPSPSLTLASSPPSPPPPHHYRHHVWRSSGWIFWLKILSQDKRARMLSSWYLQCDPGELEFDSEKENVFGTKLGTLSKVK